MDYELHEKFSTTLCTVSLFCSTIFFFAPLNIYLTNISEFPFTLYDVWYTMLAVLLLSIALISTLLLFLKNTIHQKTISLLFALAFLLWLQGNILVINYGLLNGKEINWNNYIVYGISDTALWLIMLTAAVIKSTSIYKVVRKVSIVLILIQVASVSIAWFRAPAKPYWKGYSISGKTKYNYSPKKNVIILVLDTFQTDIFQELVNENPKYKDIFQGFTYFRNSIGGFPTTYLSIPLVLTGKYYDNSVPVSDYLKSSYSSSSIPSVLKKNGYEVDLFTDRRLIYCNENIASNILRTSEGRQEDLIYTYKVALFRYLPHYLKKYFYTIGEPTDTGDPTEADLKFANEVLSKANASSQQYVFKFYHLWGTHPPFHLNENLDRVDQKYDRSGYKIQAKAALEITKRFLSALKKIGVYDNSMIFVIGDHGAGAPFGPNVLASGYTEDDLAPLEIKSEFTVASGIPLILVKPFNSHGEMAISDAPVSHSDIPITIFSALGIKGQFSGKPMFSVKESEYRERRFLEYIWKGDYEQYLSKMQEYIITGFSWLKQSWRPTYREFTSKGVINLQPPIYRFGSVLRFGKEGNAQSYQGYGWSEPENGLTWTNYKTASLIIPIKKPDKDLFLKMILSPFTAGSLKAQRVFVDVNGSRLSQLKIANSGEYRLTIPKEYVIKPSLEINFELPDATSPAKLKVGADPRILGIGMQSVVISEQSAYQNNSVIRFGQTGNAQEYQEQGWSMPEPGGTWTEGKTAVLKIPISQPNSDIILKATLSPLVTENHKEQRVIIYINGKQIGQWKVINSGEYKITIPQNYITGSIQEIKFELPDAISPVKLKINNDKRVLGVVFQSMILSEKTTK